jgi:hypothetical protein
MHKHDDEQSAPTVEHSQAKHVLLLAGVSAAVADAPLLVLPSTCAATAMHAVLRVSWSLLLSADPRTPT